MDKEQANLFAASTTNPVSAMTMTQLWEVVRNMGSAFWACSDQVSDDDYMDARSSNALQAGESNGRKFVLIEATYHYDPETLAIGFSDSFDSICIVIHERYTDKPGFWVVAKPDDDSAFSEPGNAPHPNVDLLLKLINGEVKKVAGRDGGSWTFVMHL